MIPKPMRGLDIKIGGIGSMTNQEIFCVQDVHCDHTIGYGGGYEDKKHGPYYNVNMV